MGVNIKNLLIIFIFLGMMTVRETQGVLTCLEHWELYEKEQKCVRIFKTNARTWDGARTACKMYGGDLIRVDSQDKSTFLANLHGRHITSGWIGLHRFANDRNYFHWLDDDKKIIKNRDFTLWSWAEPSSARQGEACVSFQGSWRSWNDVFCNLKNGYVCEMDAFHKPPPVCPENWKVYRNSCFRLYTDSLTWSEARKSCQSERGDLPVILNEETNTFLAKNVYSGHSTNIYLGASDHEQEGVWKWIKPHLTLDHYANWHSTKPENDGNKDCLVVSGRYMPQWEDVVCTNKYNYICEQPSITYPLICPDGWFQYSEYCFRLYEELKPWTDARDKCREEGGRLATVADKLTRSLLEHTYLPKLDTAGVWVGLNDRDEDRDYTWVDSEETNTAWICDSCLKKRVGGCVVMNLVVNMGQEPVSRVKPCTSTYMYLCEKEADRSPYACPPGWSLYNKYCFKLHQTPTNFSDARQVCESEKGHLATIPDKSTHYHLTNELFRGTTRILIGLNDIEHEDAFVWEGTNRTLVETGYSNFVGANSQKADCVAIVEDNGYHWAAMLCDDEFLPLCQIDALLADSMTSPPPSSPTRATTNYNNPVHCGNGRNASALKNTGTESSSSSGSGLSLGGLAGIFVAVFVIVAAIGVTVYLLRRRKATRTTEEFAAYHPMNDGSA